MADASRARMFAEAVKGAGHEVPKGAVGKVVLCRGCDPVMAAAAPRIMGPLLGGCDLVVCTDDDEFQRLLQLRKYDVIHFAPGACRWSAAKKPIPGGNTKTRGWTLEDYKSLCAEYQPGVPIVETTEESKMVGLLRKALDLD